ncbi:MAG: hypothetical protein OSB26_14620 [Woeseiaceae bacterium]|jgi:hypothetical protein|nr:hypothetical protein [Woeseiaceae bacterium]|tara:strand:+ start:239 stop:475 length:237 start_codon:yes stop_codon:yes gene_type:complete
MNKILGWVSLAAAGIAVSRSSDMYEHIFLLAAKFEIIANADTFMITFSTRFVLHEPAAILAVFAAASQSLLILRLPVT